MKHGVEGVPSYRHFVLAVQKGNRLLFVCETQPLQTINSHGSPKRCPFCGEEKPIWTSPTWKERANASQQG